MQVQKEHIRKLLQEIAREAFFEKGFKAVSMREISKLSGVSLSNIYNYYPCKDDLLAVVLRPLLEEMDGMLNSHNRRENLSPEVFTSEEYHRQYIQEILDIIIRYRKELKLLFLHAQESRFEDYSTRWIEKSTAVGLEYMDQMKVLYPDLDINISPFFIHFVSSWWMNMMRELAMHEELSRDDIEVFIGEYIRFSAGGWEKLIVVKRKREIDDMVFSPIE